MNFFVLPIISAGILVILFKLKLKEIHITSVFLFIIALLSSLAWLFVYSSFEDSLVISGLGYTGGWLLSFTVRKPKNYKMISTIVSINRGIFFIVAAMTFSSTLLAEVLWANSYSGVIISGTNLLLTVITGIVIWKANKKK